MPPDSRGYRGAALSFPVRPRIRAMIDREQVLHVARLARLELSDEEVERMATELSGVLDHVDKISELDLDGVEPTTHVVALENVLRADEPTPSLPRERALEAPPPIPPTAPSASPRRRRERRASRAHGRRDRAPGQRR